MEINANREELLVYVRSLQDQETNEAKRLGINTWVVFAGLVYVLLEICSALSKLAKLPDQLTLAFGATGHLYVLLVSMMFVFIALSSKAEQTLERKYIRYFSPGTSAWALITILLFFGVPTAFLWLVDSSGSLLPPQILSLTFATAKWTFTVILGLLLIISGVNDFVFETKGFPMPVIDAGTNMRRASATLLIIILIVISTGAISVIAGSISKLTADSLEPALKMMILVSLFLLGSAYLIRLKVRSARSNELDILERDIVLHSLQAKQIAARLEDRIIGKKLGSWVHDELLFARDAAAAFCLKANSAIQVAGEVKKIDAAYSRERKGRVDDFLDSLLNDQNEFKKCVLPLTEWLTATMGFLNADKELRELALQATRELQGHLSAMGNALDSARKELEKIE